MTREQNAASLQIKVCIFLPFTEPDKNATSYRHSYRGRCPAAEHTCCEMLFHMHEFQVPWFTLTLLYRSCILPGQGSTNFLPLSPSLTVYCKQHTFSCHFYMAAEVQKERQITVQTFKIHSILSSKLISCICILHKVVQETCMYLCAYFFSI